MHDVPFQTQHAESLPHEWRSRSCGIAALTMALAALHEKEGREAPHIEDLHAEALIIGGWTAHGWDHEALVRLAHNHGTPAYREEFRSVFVDALESKIGESEFSGRMLTCGLERLQDGLSHGKLPLVSVPLRFAEGGSFHLVLLTGWNAEGFFYNDSDYASAEEGKEKFIPLKSFERLWRRLAIFVG